jgi:hypothetical protein
MDLVELAPSFAATREALRAVACQVIAPARKAVDGHIGLAATGDGFGSPPFGERARRIVVRGTSLVIEDQGAVVAREPITTIGALAAIVGIEPTDDPGIGEGRTKVAPDAMLTVDLEASQALGAWYALADMALVELRDELAGFGTPSPITLWPEHFDLAFDWGGDADRRVNLGASPGDVDSDEPYLYVGPWDIEWFTPDGYWNAPFGARLGYHEVATHDDPLAGVTAFFAEGIARLAH